MKIVHSCARVVGVMVVLLLAAGGLPPAAHAQLGGPTDFSGDLLSRPRLTGDWGGVRNELARRGVWIDVDLHQTLQGVATGGRGTGVGSWGSADYTLELHSDKLGLWPGGFLRLFGESAFGDPVNREAGAIIAVNGDTLFPVPNEQVSRLTSVQLTQFLAPWVGVTLGFLDILGADANEFADDHKTKFLNPSFDFNFVTALTVPYGARGGGLVFVPFKDAVLSLLAVDPTAGTTDAGFDGIFKDGVTLTGEFRAGIKPFGLTGHQLLGVIWSHKERVTLEQDPANLVGRLLLTRFPRIGQILDPAGNTALQDAVRALLIQRAPGLAAAFAAVTPLSVRDDSWAIYYNFDQYVWQPAPDRGIGVFFRFGASDGEVNPIKYHYNAGIGGKGVIPGRPRDTFGVGWSRIELSEDLFRLLREQLDFGLKHEDVFEAWYNVAITPAVSATLDVQVVRSGLDRFVEAGRLQRMDTSVVGGLRLYVRF